MNADAVHFVRDPTRQGSALLACGNYQLLPNRTKTGMINLYSLGPGGARRPTLVPLQTVACGAVFDLKWAPVVGQRRHPLLVAAFADGRLRLFDAKNGRLACVWESGAADGFSRESSALFVEWQQTGGDTRVAAGHSDHSISLWELETSPSERAPPRLRLLSRWRAHEVAEVWSVAFDRLRPDILYSGGDDGVFKAWNTSTRSCLSSRVHPAGVCAIAPSPHHRGLVATGSYDGRARFYDTVSPRRPKLIATVDVAGSGAGVWRLRWSPNDPRLLLAACTFGGFKLLRIEFGRGDGRAARLLQAEVRAFPPPDSAESGAREHAPESLAYGCDWAPTRTPRLRASSCEGKASPAIALPVATCSFYDNRLRLWSVCSHVAVEQLPKSKRTDQGPSMGAE